MSHLGCKHSEATKQKIREARARQVFSPETLEKFRQNMIGNKKNVGRKMHPNTRAALLKANTGKNSKNWKGNKATYSSLHDWVERHLGKQNQNLVSANTVVLLKKECITGLISLINTKEYYLIG